jgi:penicillin-binding protein 1A
LDLQIQMAANQAIQGGLRGLDQDMGFRGRIGFLSPRQVKSFLQKQAEEIRSAKAGGSSRGQSIKLDEGEKYQAVVSKVGNRVRLRIGSLRAILDEDESKWASRTLGNEGVATERSLRRGLGPGDIVDVRVVGREGGIYRVSLDQDPLIQGALVAIDPSNGYVRSLVGGYDYSAVANSTGPSKPEDNRVRPLSRSSIRLPWIPSTIPK